MADISANLAIRAVQPQLAALGGTPIVAPIGCSQVVLTNTDTTNAAVIFTDPANPTGTGRSLPANSSITLQASVLAWGPGGPVCYVSAPLEMTVVCTFTR